MRWGRNGTQMLEFRSWTWVGKTVKGADWGTEQAGRKRGRLMGSCGLCESEVQTQAQGCVLKQPYGISVILSQLTENHRSHVTESPQQNSLKWTRGCFPQFPTFLQYTEPRFHDFRVIPQEQVEPLWAAFCHLYEAAPQRGRQDRGFSVGTGGSWLILKQQVGHYIKINTSV